MRFSHTTSKIARRYTLALLTALLLAPLAVSQAAEIKRPNILIVINDDQSWLECSAYGNSSVRTPAFDRVARAGVLFTRAYCSAPSCAPARAALLTGRNFWELEQGAFIQAWLPAKFATLPERLEVAGYHAGYTGKGWGPGVREPTGQRADPAGRAWNSVRIKSPPEGISNVDYAANFTQFLEAKPQDKPFYFWAGLFEPHHPHGPDGHGKIGASLDAVKIPGFVPDTPGVRRARGDYLYEVQHADRTLGTLLKLLEERGELANTLVIVTADNGSPIPRAKANVHDWGVHVPLAMMWPARAPAGRTVSDFIGFPDLGPTILDAAGLPVPSEMSGRSVLKTLLSTCSDRVDPARDFTVNGIEWHGNLPPLDIAARMIRDDRFQYIVNYSSTPRYGASERGPQPDDRYAANAERLDVMPLLAAHSDRPELQPFLRLIKEPRPREELYDCVTDPDQLQNLADQPEFAEVKARLRARLETYQRQTHDPRITGDMVIYEQTLKFVQARKAAGYNDTEAHRRKAAPGIR
jgi:N-sulfoglucosamine sulfohydrolase